MRRWREGWCRRWRRRGDEERERSERERGWMRCKDEVENKIDEVENKIDVACHMLKNHEIAPNLYFRGLIAPTKTSRVGML